MNVPLRELHLFAGAGGGILGGMLLGHTPVCAVELEKYPRRVLLQRQRDGALPWFPIWDDVCTFDGKPWRGRVDVVCAGWPCQDISAAGKGAGITGSRSGLWSEVARILDEVRPRYFFGENSPMLTSRGLDRVLLDLSRLGYVGCHGVLGAAEAGAPHRRNRIWILAHANSHDDALRGDGAYHAPEVALRGDHAGGGVSCSREGCEGLTGEGAILAHAQNSGDVRRIGALGEIETNGRTGAGPDDGISGWWAAESDLGGVAYGMAEGLDGPWGPAWESGTPRVAKGVPDRVGRLKAIGNGQVPQCAALAWSVLMDRLIEQQQRESA